MFSITQVKNDAKRAMAGNYGYAILALILLMLVLFGGALLGPAGMIVVAGAIMVCQNLLFLDIAKGQFKGTDSIYGGFQHFWKSLVATLWQLLVYAIILVPLFILDIILFIVMASTSTTWPWIIVFLLSIAALVGCLYLWARLFLTYYYVVDRPDLTAKECVAESFKATKGRTLKLFVYLLSWILWPIGCFFTAGILALYFVPYFLTANAHVYIALTAEIKAEKPKTPVVAKEKKAPAAAKEKAPAGEREEKPAPQKAKAPAKAPSDKKAPPKK